MELQFFSEKDIYLYPVIDSLYDNFHARLIERFGHLLGEREVQLCCLLAAGFSTKEISVVTNQSPYTVYQRKSDIRRKLRMEVFRPMQFLFSYLFFV